jgi:hypothetical protein
MGGRLWLKDLLGVPWLIALDEQVWENAVQLEQRSVPKHFIKYLEVLRCGVRISQYDDGRGVKRTIFQDPIFQSVSLV